MLNLSMKSSELEDLSETVELESCKVRPQGFHGARRFEPVDELGSDKLIADRSLDSVWSAGVLAKTPHILPHNHASLQFGTDCLSGVYP